MSFLTKNIFKYITNSAVQASILHRPFYRVKAKDILKHTNNSVIYVSENTNCDEILDIMNSKEVHNVSIVNKKNKIVGNLDYNTIKDIVDFQKFAHFEFEIDRENLKRYGGN